MQPGYMTKPIGDEHEYSLYIQNGTRTAKPSLLTSTIPGDTLNNLNRKPQIQFRHFFYSVKQSQLFSFFNEIKNTMNSILYIIAVILIIGWALGAFAYSVIILA
ncbi:MAG: hypothetical protein JWQ66_4693 [Mucilaginibacter sp.]|nr:hypothetical protein [Mucilaginibacter sp.]